MVTVSFLESAEFTGDLTGLATTPLPRTPLTLFWQARRSRQVPPRAAPSAAWPTSPTSRAGWVVPATGTGPWEVGASPRPRTPSPLS